MIDEIVQKYLALYPKDRKHLTNLLKQIKADEALNDRKNFNGHITGSAYILSPDKSKILFVYHKLFNKWLQPGGHWEAEDIGPWLAAAREAAEETGVVIDKQIVTHGSKRMPFYIDTHLIQNRPHKKEPAHDHHDFSYLFVARHEKLKHRSKEVNIMKTEWMPFDAPEIEHLQSRIVRIESFLHPVA